MDFSQWRVLKVPHLGLNGTYMVRSYIDMQWRSIDLSHANLHRGAPSLRTPVETGQLNTGNALSVLKPYIVSVPPGSTNGHHRAEDSRRLSDISCTTGSGFDRIDGFSCRIFDLGYSTQGYIVPPYMVLALAIGLLCCMCGACGGYLLAWRQHKAGFELLSQ